MSIVGTGQRTVTGIERRGAQFRYEVSAAGDGTVATAAAGLAGAAHYCLRCEHSQLPREARVATAIVELLQHGATTALRAGVHARKGRSVYVTDAQLRRTLGRKIDWHALEPGLAAPLSECTERPARILSTAALASQAARAARWSAIGFDDRAELQQLSESYATLAARAKSSGAFFCRTQPL